jgi:hypothetical protein
MLKRLIFTLLLSVPTVIMAQIPDSSHLPLVYINTNFQSIPNEPKVMADMRALDNGYNQYNHITDTNFVYNGKAGIERRGSISQLWAQKSYALETRNPDSTARDVPLLGMPPENDWVLYAPYDDHSLMRNVISYEIGRAMGYWAPRTKYCEFILNTAWPDYRGIYIVMEKIKRDSNRVRISKLKPNENSGDDLTGGYIISIDKNIWAQDSGWTTPNPPGVFIKYVYPKAEEITPQQKNYIRTYVDSFENALLSPNWAHYTQGYRKYIEPNSFIDFFIIQELSKNIDAFKRSGYMYKDKYSKGGRLRAGPFWDFNSAWGNPKLCGFDTVGGWAHQMTCWVNSSYPVPFWWNKMLQDSVFTRDLKCRWITLRAGILDTSVLFQKIDSIKNYIGPAAGRHFSRWQLNGTFQGDIDTLKMFIRSRIAWLDAKMPGNCWNLNTPGNPEENLQVNFYPNPFSGEIFMELGQSISGQTEIQIIDALGKIVFSTRFNPGTEGNKIRIPAENLSAGIYFAMVRNGENVISRKLVKTF